MSRDSLATVTSLRQGHAMRLDGISPYWHEATICHTLVEVPPTSVYASIRASDLGALPARALLYLRALPDRALQRLGGITPSPIPRSLGEALEEGAPWTRLAEAPDSELVAGAIGSVWSLIVQWAEFEPSEFTSFADPGYAKIAAGVSVRHYGADRSLLSMEVRAVATSAGARRALGRYWRLFRPFIGLVVRSAAHGIRAHAEHRGPLAVQPM